MDRLQQFRVFVRVADMASFIHAANALELPRATVSAAIHDLETELGARLLHRTTRRVTLTSDGAALLARVRPLLAEADAIALQFRPAAGGVAGRLCVDVPSRIARKLIVPALPEWLPRHPALELRLGSTDRDIDLVREGVDAVVRVGALADSSLVVHRLGELELINCASPAYLREHGVPEATGDLAHGHLVIGYAAPGDGRAQPWEYRAGGTDRALAIASRVTVNNAENYIACCRAGLGLIQIPRFDVAHLLDSGQLVQVLAGFPPAPMPIAVLYPHRRQRSARLDEFVAWFTRLIQPHLNARGK
ncbi:MAG TPA: LysR family transcriptional regulator [Rhodanobacteraceae bacterium]|nr:LysR family transcriptional regulator [Rhodanobacteraceae bacterium]